MKSKINFSAFLVLILFMFSVFYSPPKAAADADSVFYGILVSSDKDILSPNNVPFPFNVKKFGLDSMRDPNDNTKIIIPQDGVYRIHLSMTALGLLYGGPTSERAIYEVVANWCGVETICKHLDYDVVFQRFEIQNSYGANGNTMEGLVYLTRGTKLQVITTGKDASGLKIESNPYGTGNLSPRWGVYYVGSLP